MKKIVLIFILLFLPLNVNVAEMVDSYTKLLLHFDGADTAVSDIDYSGQNHIITFNGTAQLDTVQKEFGTASLLLDGATDYLTCPDSADWNFGNGDLTIDFWVRFNALPTTAGGDNLHTFVNQWNDPNRSFIFYITNVADVYTLRFNISTDGSASDATSSDAITPVVDTWYHIAVVRDSGTVRYFLDGVAKGTADLSGKTNYDAAEVLTIGDISGGGSLEINGWMDELRISKGIARWTANFTPLTYPYHRTANKIRCF